MRGVGIAAMAVLLATQGAYALTIDFNDAGVSSGTVSIVGGHLQGSNISIGEMEVQGAPVNDGVYAVTGGLLNFNTDPSDNFITVEGTVVGVSGTLLNGEVTFWDQPNSNVGNFYLEGVDYKNPDLLAYFGIPADTKFNLFGFTLTSSWDKAELMGNAKSTDILNSVPEPTSLLLLGAGLAGLGIVRRKIARG